MTKNNPYIDLVKEHNQIMCNTEKIYQNKSNWDKYFKNSNEMVLEIGTGLGNFFSREISKNPNLNFIGMEIKYKRLYISAEKALGNLNNYADNGVRPKRILKKIEKKENNTSPFSVGSTPKEGGIRNLETNNPNFVLLKDMGEHINNIFGESEISLTYIFFPDPWSKKKRWLKNRLLQEEFLNNLYTITKSGGKTIIKTDHLEYFEFILLEIKKTSWQIIKKSYDWENENSFDNSETTEFQQLFRGQDIKINYLELSK